jgi:dihydropyrimidinase
LRPKHHHDHLWRGLKNYDLQVVATDHCPFCMKDQKELGRNDFSKIPNGMPGVETRLHLLWEGVVQSKISLDRFVEITSTAPAKIFGMYGNMRVDYSPFESRKVPASPSHILSRGELIVQDDKWVGKTKKGRDQFLRRSTFGL